MQDFFCRRWHQKSGVGGALVDLGTYMSHVVLRRYVRGPVKHRRNPTTTKQLAVPLYIICSYANRNKQINPRAATTTVDRAFQQAPDAGSDCVNECSLSKSPESSSSRESHQDCNFFALVAHTTPMPTPGVHAFAPTDHPIT